MKKILLVLILIVAMLLSSCDALLQSAPDTDGDSISGDGGDGNTEDGSGNSEGGNTEDGSGNSEGGNTDSGNSGSDGSGNNSSGGTADASHDHKDANEDEKCDVCGICVLVELDFYVINDLHGKLTDGGSQPGVDELTTYLKSAYESEDNVLLLSSGDMWQGGSESNLTKGLIVTDWMNELDFVAMTLGNHEFDWGEEYVEANSDAAEFPFLAINIYDRSTNRRVDYADASVTVEMSGVKIGIIGAIGDCYSSIAPEKVEDIYFKTGSDLTELIMAESNKLRAEGVDIIIYSIHDGHDSSGGSVISDSKLSGYYSPSLSKGNYVDIVFEGHTHKKYTLMDSYGVYHVQNGGENQGIGHAEIVFNIASDELTVTESEIIASSVYSSLTSDPLVDTLLEKYENMIAIGNEVIGTNAKKRYSEELEQLVAKLYLEAGLEKWGTKYKIFLGGGFIKARSPYNLEAGSVKYSDLQMIFPFDNEIVLCSIKGKDLRSKFINTKNEDYFIALSDYGTANKASISDSATYYVIVDSYTSTYAYNNLTEIERFDSKTFARDLLKEYIKAGGLS